jgi:hypothetical protein
MLSANLSNKSKRSTNPNTKRGRKITETKNHTTKEVKEITGITGTTTGQGEKREDIKSEKSK